MHPEAITAEIDDLKKSYGPMVKSIEEIGRNELKIVTQEGDLIHTRLTAKGWDILNHPECLDHDKIYETIEALLMSASPKFRTSWDQELSSRLDNLERLNAY